MPKFQAVLTLVSFAVFFFAFASAAPSAGGVQAGQSDDVTANSLILEFVKKGEMKKIELNDDAGISNVTGFKKRDNQTEDENEEDDDDVTDDEEDEEEEGDDYDDNGDRRKPKTTTDEDDPDAESYDSAYDDVEK